MEDNATLPGASTRDSRNEHDAPKPKRFLRPSTQKPPQRRAPPATKVRFEAEVLGGRLWQPACQSAAKDDFVGQVPMEFTSPDEYIAVLDPFVLEEAREGLKATWTDHCAASNKTWQVQVEEIDSFQGKGWFVVKLRLVGKTLTPVLMSLQPNSVAVLTLGRPPPRGTSDWLSSAIRKDDGIVVAGIVTSSMRGEPDAGKYILLKIHPQCTIHEDKAELGGTADTAAPPCASVLSKLQSTRRGWWVSPAGMLVTSEREFNALHAVKSIDPELLKVMMKPKLLGAVGKKYENDELRRRMWPKQARHQAFIRHLKSTYDYKQLEAIEMAACHLGIGQRTQKQLYAKDRSGESLPTLPFILIQGPPGTGKTHTVCGVLNVWHLVAYQQYYDGLVANLVMGISKHQTANDHSILATKPRILICTPSNAACDELMSRVMRHGFCDGSGKMYNPNVVRIGADDSIMSHAIRERSLKSLVDRYQNMPNHELLRRRVETSSKLAAVEHDITVLQFGAGSGSGTGTGNNSTGSTESSLQGLLTSPQAKRVRHLMERTQTAHRLRLELEKLEACLQNKHASRRSEIELEAAILGEAEMVFATLSSTQRKVFKSVAHKIPFHTVLIDEAGQSSEVAALQPLCFGARRVVLVGDPQQLPATILSEAGKAMAMERSLFERLQAQGCPVVMLQVQYRMHPEIRSFPSRHFYQGLLQDATSVTSLPPEPYHAHPFLRPYLVFDVAKGKESRRGGGGSLSNLAEAQTALSLCELLIKCLGQSPPRSPVSLAIITPYREQKALLLETFQAASAVKKQKAVDFSIETVDSYQGRQVDIVILSCVRAGAARGLGFVNDVRRMNVAITRAKRSLWILGSLSTLRSNLEWEALVKDAEARKLVVSESDVELLESGMISHLQPLQDPPTKPAHPPIEPSSVVEQRVSTESKRKRHSKRERSASPGFQ